MSESLGGETAPSTAQSSKSRPKPQLSCTLCRARKQKCDRQLPCSKCAKLPPGSCIYPGRLPLHNKQTPQFGRNADTSNVQHRLQRLEQVLSTLSPDQRSRFEANLDGGEDGVSPNASESKSSATAASPYIVDDEYGEARPVTSLHWASILSEIASINESLSIQNKNPGSIHLTPSSDLQNLPRIIFDRQNQVSVDELICSAPSKKVMSLLTKFMVDNGSVLHQVFMVHFPTFQTECEQFWNDPHSMSLTWLSMMYSLAALALQCAHILGKDIEGVLLAQATSDVYTTKAVQCLTASDYARPVKYTIEALLLNLSCEHFFLGNNHSRSAVLYSVILRLAFRAGYHRDPKHFPGISVLEAEIRRRSWALIYHIDIIFAQRDGLPRAINDLQADTELPLNVIDDDLALGMTVMPPARPDTEPTDIGYLNYKMRLLKIAGRVIDLSQSLDTNVYSNVMALETELQSCGGTRPPWLVLSAYDDENKLPPHRLLQCIDVDVIKHRAHMMLHRGCFIQAKSNKNLEMSRQICLSAAQQTLQQQYCLFECTQKPLPPDVNISIAAFWRLMIFLSHDFLLAAMIICLDLDYDLGSEHSGELPVPQQSQTHMDQLQALKLSQHIWANCPDQTGTIFQARGILDKILARYYQKNTTAKTSSGLANIGAQSGVAAHDQEMLAAPTDQWLDELPTDGGFGSAFEAGSLNRPLEETVGFDSDLQDVHAIFDPSTFGMDWTAWDSQFPLFSWGHTHY